MDEYDLIVRGGTVVTASDQFRADVGLRGGRIAALAENLRGGPTLDAGGLLVLPGAVDSHCHIEQLRADGSADEESFHTGSIAAPGGWHHQRRHVLDAVQGRWRARTAGRVSPPSAGGRDGGLCLPPDPSPTRPTR